MRGLRKPFIMVVCCACLFVVYSCGNKADDMLKEMSGVWRGKSDGMMVIMRYSENKFQMLEGDKAIPVSLGEIDTDNKLVNLNVTRPDGKPAVWTIREIWDPQHKSLTLQLTLDEGEQEEFAFVRKVSVDDLNVIANAEAIDRQKATAPAPGSQPGNNFTPSFDCAKASTGPERLICSNQELAEADVKMAQVYKQALAVTSDKENLKREQGDWRRNIRDACSTAKCMLNAYYERMNQLASVGGK